MRRKDREMDENFALKIVDTCDYSVVSMVMPDGRPYCVALSLARIGSSLYFHCAREGQKLEALHKNPLVCVCCVGDVRPAQDKFTTEYESAVVTGIASRVEDQAEKTEALRAICLRYTPDNMTAFNGEVSKSLPITDVWCISMEQITGKRKESGN